MKTEQALRVATEYVQQHGFDMIERAGEKGDQEYFHFWIKGSEGKKLGKPLVIKVSRSGTITDIYDLAEIMWAIDEAMKNRKGKL